MNKIVVLFATASVLLACEDKSECQTNADCETGEVCEISHDHPGDDHDHGGVCVAEDTAE